MSIIGITRIRNEADIIKSTLDHVSEFVDEIMVFDDCSTDSTVEVCKSHEKVTKIIRAKSWEPNPVRRQVLEGTQRQAVYNLAAKSSPDWVYYFDSDEFAYLEGVDLEDTSVGAYEMRLFDYYITPEDVDKTFLERKWIGPEYRDIMTLFRPTPFVRFHTRVPAGVGQKSKAGFIKHYGKAISVEQWESTCDYYINHLFENQPGNSTISEKWRKRKGKAVHDGISDFGRKLITWADRDNPSLVVDNSFGQAER